MKKTLLLIFSTINIVLFSQTSSNQVVWEFSQKQVSKNQIDLYFTAKIYKGFRLYSSNIPPNESGPLATIFLFNDSTSKDYSITEKIIEKTKPIEKDDPVFQMKVKYFEGKAVFIQRINVLTELPFRVKGEIFYMICNDKMCLMPNPKEFNVKIKVDKNLVFRNSETTKEIKKETEKIREIIEKEPIKKNSNEKGSDLVEYIIIEDYTSNYVAEDGYGGYLRDLEYSGESYFYGGFREPHQITFCNTQMHIKQVIYRLYSVKESFGEINKNSLLKSQTHNYNLTGNLLINLNDSKKARIIKENNKTIEQQIYNKDGSRNYTYQYKYFDTKVEKNLYQSNGEKYMYDVYEFNSSKQIKEIFRKSETLNFYSKSQFDWINQRKPRYISLKTNIKKNRSRNSSLEYARRFKVSYKYNEKGNIIERLVTGARDYRVTYTYQHTEHDDYTNWTKKIVYISSGEGLSIPTYIVEREITYYK